MANSRRKPPAEPPNLNAPATKITTLSKNNSQRLQSPLFLVSPSRGAVRRGARVCRQYAICRAFIAVPGSLWWGGPDAFFGKDLTEQAARSLAGEDSR